MFESDEEATQHHGLAMLTLTRDAAGREMVHVTSIVGWGFQGDRINLDRDPPIAPPANFNIQLNPDASAAILKALSLDPSSTDIHAVWGTLLKVLRKAGAAAS